DQQHVVPGRGEGGGEIHRGGGLAHPALLVHHGDRSRLHVGAPSRPRTLRPETIEVNAPERPGPAPIAPGSASAIRCRPEECPESERTEEGAAGEAGEAAGGGEAGRRQGWRRTGERGRPPSRAEPLRRRLAGGVPP